MPPGGQHQYATEPGRTLLDPEDRSQALVFVVKALASTGQPRQAAELAQQAVDILRTFIVHPWAAPPPLGGALRH